jgi:hypothetical protein
MGWTIGAGLPISRAMIRLLLSLLALVSGLAVQGVPAQARLCGAHDTEIGAPAPAQVAAHVAVRVAALGVVHRAPAALDMGPALRLPTAQTDARPGVLIGIDRARE